MAVLLYHFQDFSIFMLADFFDRLLDARNVPDIRRIYLQSIGKLGFGNCLYVARFNLPMPDSVLREDYHHFSNFPVEVTQHLLARRLLGSSHWLQWSLTNDGVVANRDIMSPDEPSETERIAMQHGLDASYVVSLRGRIMGSHGMVVLNPFAWARYDDADRSWRQNGETVRLLSWLMHLRMATIRREQDKRVLTRRQREVLQWSSAGKTVSEVATILGVSVATVEKHLRLARSAMAADSTAHAILKAHLTQELFT